MPTAYLHSSHDHERTILSECLEVPVVRDRLQRGVSLQEFSQLQKFLEDNREEKYVQKEYGRMIQDLEFLEAVGALRLPIITPGQYISIVPHWVAIRGYFNVHPITLAEEGVQHRFVINTPAVLAPLLVLDTDAWSIFRKAMSFARINRYQALPYLLYILDVLRMSEMPLGEVVNENYVKYVVSQYDSESIIDESYKAYEGLVMSGRVLDERGTILRLMSQTFCLPTNNWIFSDGWYYLVSLPSATFSGVGDEDCSGNYVENWDFFTSES